MGPLNYNNVIDILITFVTASFEGRGANLSNIGDICFFAKIRGGGLKGQPDTASCTGQECGHTLSSKRWGSLIAGASMNENPFLFLFW